MMLAAYIERLGSTDEIRYGPLPIPAYGPTDVLVQVEATTVNAVDTHIRAGRYRTSLPFPFILGRDLVGTVAALGSGVDRFTVGDRVWSNSLGHAGRQGTAAEYATVPADRLYPLPEGVNAITAVAVAHPAATAFLAITTHANVRAGETVYVGGGAGNVGSAAVLIASRAGAHVITAARTEDHAYCRSLGANLAIDYRNPDAQQELLDAAPQGIDVFIDTSGRQDLTAAVDALAPRGRIIAMAGLGNNPTVSVGPLYTRDGRVLGFAISNAKTHELGDAAVRIQELLQEGSLAPLRTEELPLSEIARAHHRIETDGGHGLRIVLRLPNP